jgi:transposase
MKHAPFEYRQHIRNRAAELFEKGKSNTEVANELSVSRKTVIIWRSGWDAGGLEGLRIGTPGPESQVSDEQWRQIEQALLEGPRVHGYDTDLWTLERIAELIEKLTGVSYNPSWVWKLLRRLDWSCQRPHCQAKERNEEKIARWKEEEWPRIKKGRWKKEPQ